MQTINFKLLTEALSKARLEAYRPKNQQGFEQTTPFAIHLWNISLCKELYPALQTIEVILRNSIDRIIAQYTQNALWLFSGLLHRYEQTYVDETITNLQKFSRDIDHNQLVSELSFGFWTSLLDRRYEQVLWPNLLRAVFPNLSRRERTRHNISTRFNKIRRLRNRVFHHQHIWHWQDLLQQHQNIIESIGWIEPSAKEFLRSVDFFEKKYTEGYQYFIHNLKEIMY